jgi:hypothetical protein
MLFPVKFLPLTGYGKYYPGTPSKFSFANIATGLIEKKTLTVRTDCYHHTYNAYGFAIQ